MLIVIHACDSRAGVKKAAQKKADNLSSTNGSTNDPAGGNEFVDHSTQDETPLENNSEVNPYGKRHIHL